MVKVHVIPISNIKAEKRFFCVFKVVTGLRVMGLEFSGCRSARTNMEVNGIADGMDCETVGSGGVHDQSWFMGFRFISSS